VPVPRLTHTCAGHCRAALNSAVERSHLARNPVLVSRPPRYEAPEVEPLSAADARKVLGVAVYRRNAARWSVALALGLRQGEALGLRWSDLDLGEGRLTVRAQLQPSPGSTAARPLRRPRRAGVTPAAALSVTAAARCSCPSSPPPAGGF
jgi:integrase